jgi:purine-binding chemotaxis protein CheW
MLRDWTSMPQAHQLVVFTLDEQRYAVPLQAVERIVRMVEITPVPQTPEIVLGLINVQGRIIPVVDIRKRFCLPAREPHPSDQLLIARTSKRAVALVVDAVSEVVTLSGQELVTAETILARLEYVTGVVKRPDGLILIHDLDRFLSLEEEQALHDAIDALTP